MAIVAEKNLFTLHTDHSTYQMKADDLGYLLHLYYGERAEVYKRQSKRKW